ncbi:uncharacterized protein BCN122_III0549 [Burkholderia cenocepacia]|nr:uncharacterized protein BCN122_III0549 [Burkholderia cenocepacia]
MPARTSSARSSKQRARQRGSAWFQPRGTPDARRVRFDGPDRTREP